MDYIDMFYGGDRMETPYRVDMEALHTYQQLCGDALKAFKGDANASVAFDPPEEPIAHHGILFVFDDDYEFLSDELDVFQQAISEAEDISIGLDGNGERIQIYAMFSIYTKE